MSSKYEEALAKNREAQTASLEAARELVDQINNAINKLYNLNFTILDPQYCHIKLRELDMSEVYKEIYFVTEEDEDEQREFY